jgi:hypothetical protein
MGISINDLTVGKLKEILNNLPDDMVIRGDFPSGEDNKGYDVVSQIYTSKDFLSELDTKEALYFVVSNNPSRDSGIGYIITDKLLWEV